MARVSLIDRLKQDVFIIDGAMGTQLMQAGIETGGCNDYQNIAAPDVVGAIHGKYFQAGCDAVLTNTLGASRYALLRHGHGDKVKDINVAAGQIARKAAGEDRYVLGDIGPCGDFLEPLGTVVADELLAAYADQAKALIAGGVDGFAVETMTAIDEAVVAVKGVRAVSDLPIFTSLSFDRAGDEFKTMMGVSPADVVSQLAPLGVTAIGYNCGTLTMEEYIELTKVFAIALDGSGIYLIAEPNAGKPELVDDNMVYNLTADRFAQAMLQIKNAGANIAGGCCGTSPVLIEAMAKILR